MAALLFHTSLQEKSLYQQSAYSNAITLFSTISFIPHVQLDFHPLRGEYYSCRDPSPGAFNGRCINSEQPTYDHMSATTTRWPVPSPHLYIPQTGHHTHRSVIDPRQYPTRWTRRDHDRREGRLSSSKRYEIVLQLARNVRHLWISDPMECYLFNSIPSSRISFFNLFTHPTTRDRTRSSRNLSTLG